MHLTESTKSYSTTPLLLASPLIRLRVHTQVLLLLQNLPDHRVVHRRLVLLLQLRLTRHRVLRVEMRHRVELSHRPLVVALYQRARHRVQLHLELRRGLVHRRLRITFSPQ